MKAATATIAASDGMARGRKRRAGAVSDKDIGFGIATRFAYTRLRENRDFMKIIVVAALIAVIVSLFSALYYLYRDRGQGTRMARMLAVRVAVSASLVAFLVISYQMGWIAPTGLR
jgi:Protein of unknown function (DUF2909)